MHLPRFHLPPQPHFTPGILGHLNCLRGVGQKCGPLRGAGGHCNKPACGPGDVSPVALVLSRHAFQNTDGAKAQRGVKPTFGELQISVFYPNPAGLRTSLSSLALVSPTVFLPPFFLALFLLFLLPCLPPCLLPFSYLYPCPLHTYVHSKMWTGPAPSLRRALLLCVTPNQIVYVCHLGRVRAQF